MNHFSPESKVCRRRGLVALIHEGIAEAHKYGLSSLRAQAMIVVLMFGFGHGCTCDPLYPGSRDAYRCTRSSTPQAAHNDWKEKP
jgi:hypothetical protein